MRTLISNGTVVTAEGSQAADVLIDGETIAAIGADLAGAGISDMFSFAGQMHWSSVPEFDHWETGQFRMQVPPWEDMDAMIKNSPLAKVHVMPAKSILMVGLRGVGKTVLLDRMRDDAEAAGIRTLPSHPERTRTIPKRRRSRLR